MKKRAIHNWEHLSSQPLDGNKTPPPFTGTPLHPHETKNEDEKSNYSSKHTKMHND